jgi:molecular chaperone GrpE (heat shock protein)
MPSIKKSKISRSRLNGQRKTKTNIMKGGGEFKKDWETTSPSVTERLARIENEFSNPNSGKTFTLNKSQGLGQFGRYFNNRTNNQIKKKRGEDQFFRELGRPMTKYNTNNQETWREKYLERAEKYLNNNNRATEKDRYAILKRAMRRMNNNLYKTRATLERTHSPRWDRKNRNNKFDRMFTMTKKQLERIRKQPNDYLDNPDDFMMDPEGENTPYIHKINNETQPGWSPSSKILSVSERMKRFQ